MLVFVSGMNEIASLMDEVKTYAQQTHRWIILALHSALSIEDQDKVRTVWYMYVYILYVYILYVYILYMCM